VTVASGGSLGGTGTIGGAVTVQSGGALTPGVGGIGTLTINNTLSLAGTTAMEISNSGGTLTSDRISGVSTLAYGGALVVTNVGPSALAAGNSFTLFSASTRTGSFSSITLPSLSAGLAWNTSQLSVNGTISVTGTLPSGWTGADIGSVGVAGGSSQSGGVYTVSGSGADIGGTADAFQFASQTLVGDGEIRARVTSQTNTNSWAKAGVMIRDGSGAGAVNALVAITPGNGFTFQSRTTASGSTSSTAGPALNAVPNNWVRLTRSGTLVSAYASADGAAWTPVGTVNLTMASSVSVGLAVSSGNNSVLSAATFDNVSITSFPSPWLSADVGTTLLQGSAEYYGSTYTVKGAGTFGGTADGFHYVYQTLSADGSIVARVSTLQNTGTGESVGVMMRDTLTDTSKMAALTVDGGGNWNWQTRTSTGGGVSTTAGGSGTAPNLWVQLVRSGDTITASSSPDGTNWTVIGSTTVSMASNCYIGLSVASGSTSALDTSSFDNVTVVP
jgi:regulation of enolase protein 1 (concanavalin A-like superfamily)